MLRLGFAPSWVDLIMRCVSSVSSRVRVRGVLSEAFHPQRGLRQGLSVALTAAQCEGPLPGVRASKHGPPVNHLLFADDILVFLLNNMSEVHCLKDILSTYSTVSGQKVNFSKSTAYFSPRTPSAHQIAVHETLGVQEVDDPGIYLGVLLLIGRIKEMSRSIRRFWWSGKGSARGWPLVAWDDLYLPKAAGGIGFKDLHLFNIALLGKQIWRLLSVQGSLLYRTLRAKYFPDGDLLSASAPTRSSFAWKGLHRAMLRLRDGFFWTLGIDSQVRLFRDRLGGFSHVTLVGGYVDREEIPLHCREFMVPRQARWDHSKLLAHLSPGDVDSILEVPISQSGLICSFGAIMTRASTPFDQDTLHVFRDCPDSLMALQQPGFADSLLSADRATTLSSSPFSGASRDVATPGCMSALFILCILLSRMLSRFVMTIHRRLLPPRSSRCRCPPPRWRPPLAGSVKINVDGAFLPSARLGAIGVIARDSSGAVLGGFAKPVPVRGPASTMEVSALFAGLEFAIANGWASALIESDAAVIVNNFHRPTMDLSLLWDLLAPSRALLAASNGCLRVGFVSR
ncbi:hypothetical protein GQ457_16G018030 [Hibiscus cannabinus]